MQTAVLCAGRRSAGETDTCPSSVWKWHERTDYVSAQTASIGYMRTVTNVTHKAMDLETEARSSKSNVM